MTALDRVFDLLREERRRYALYYLEAESGAVRVEELAETVAEWENDPDDGGAPWSERERVELTLQHNHLPKASEVEFIEYDADEEVVRASGTPHEYDAVITVARLIERPESDGE